MKTKLLKLSMYVMAYSSLAYTALCGGYVVMPEEIKLLIPEFTWLTALVSGGATSVLGTVILVVDHFIKKSKKKQMKKYSLLANNYIDLKQEIVSVGGSQQSLGVKLDELNAIITHLKNLVNADLQAKLSNPLIDAKVKELIEEVKGAECSE